MKKAILRYFVCFTNATRTNVFKYLNDEFVFAPYSRIDKMRCDIAAYSDLLPRRDCYHGLQSDMSPNLGIHYSISAKLIL